MNERWEYKVLDVSANLAGRPGEKIEETLNQLGDKGWELVNALRANLMEPTRLYLKRKKE